VYEMELSRSHWCTMRRQREKESERYASVRLHAIPRLDLSAPSAGKMRGKCLTYDSGKNRSRPSSVILAGCRKFSLHARAYFVINDLVLRAVVIYEHRNDTSTPERNYSHNYRANDNTVISALLAVIEGYLAHKINGDFASLS